MMSCEVQSAPVRQVQGGAAWQHPVSLHPQSLHAVLKDSQQEAPTLLQSLYPSIVRASLSTSRQLRCLVLLSLSSASALSTSLVNIQEQVTELQVLVSRHQPDLQRLKLQY